MDSKNYRKMLAFVVLTVTVLCSVTTAQLTGSCVTTLTSLSPCVNYITGNSTAPSQPCCTQLDTVVKSSPECICSAVNGPIPNIGLNINRTLALQLPIACNIQTPPLTQCNAVNGSTTLAPALSPAESPAVDSPGLALTPTSSSPATPSETGAGTRAGAGAGGGTGAGAGAAGGGSKTVPSTGAGSSSGNVAGVPVNLVVFAIFVVYISSLVAKF